MHKKSNTNQKTRKELRAQLARDIASILANPETPAELYGEIADYITDWSSALLNAEAHTAHYIERSLESYLRAEAVRTKGGAR